ncbi:bifunctional 2-polyprenyl-6-hydroxyphenol methylase/3-demethylubiquinol 3-O-methyltransferase UbiG [Chryseobacterium sp. JUb7]|uniref:class I SAM-dependent methyltransferase n=1 Tax=Chryseobacterium sp. JUb7 TaxID=2940599 RepID=UPI00216A05DB|nr:class I SAM-dependent methyltransferase [Chryseobacterium sp. JUb7]MCS3532840.1 SAM-dependent methyltransferase [Chryseobacterium sp. JUb7]
MDKNWLKRWDDRYRDEEYAYGKNPNMYFQQELDGLKPGKILLAAEGEGRNAVYAAKKGWQVTAFDISEEGKNKALQLAEQHHVEIDYQVGELPELGFEEEYFDVIALVYAHFPAEIKSVYHRLLNGYLKKGGFIIFEAFSKKHLEYRLKNGKVGGPADIESLFSIEELENDFKNFDFQVFKEQIIDLNEGMYHIGTGSVIRLTGIKK